MEPSGRTSWQAATGLGHTAVGRPSPSVSPLSPPGGPKLDREPVMPRWFEGPLAAFDTETTGVDRELRRHRDTGLVTYWSRSPLCVLDPRVLDKHADRYRRGHRTLTDLCAHYGVALTAAHDAAADAVASLAVTRAIGLKYAEGAL